MVPTTRQSRRGVTWAQVQAQREALSSGLANTRGLPIFPAELLLEILSHFCSVPIPFSPANNLPLNPSYWDRGAALRMLSQLCRSLRRSLLPETWRHLEVCSGDLSPEQRKPMKGFRGSIFAPWEKAIATELVQQLETVTIRNASLAQHVQWVLDELPSSTPLINVPWMSPELSVFSLGSTLVMQWPRNWHVAFPYFPISGRYK